MSTLRRLFPAIAGVALLGCSGSIGTPDSGDPGDGGTQQDVVTMPTDGATPTTLAAMSIAWNPMNVALGHVTAVTESGDNVLVFSDMGVSVVQGGMVLANDSSVHTWQPSAMVIPAADHTTDWPVAVDGDGHVQRVRSLMALEDVSARYGLTGLHVHAVGTPSATITAFAYDGGVALADGATVNRYDDPSFATAFAAGGGRLAGAAGDMVRVFTASSTAMPMEVSYPLPGAAFVAFDAAGRLIVATDHTVYAEDATHALQQLFNSGAPVHGLVTSGTRVWFAAGGELGTVDGASIALTHGLGIAADAQLAPSPSGDVWVIASGTLARYGLPAMADETYWVDHVQPVYTRVCATCHAPGNQISYTDLSTYARWATLRSTIRMRVITQAGTARAMPPPNGPQLMPAEQSVIDTWTAMGMGGDAGM